MAEEVEQQLADAQAQRAELEETLATRDAQRVEVVDRLDAVQTENDHLRKAVDRQKAELQRVKSSGRDRYHELVEQRTEAQNARDELRRRLQSTEADPVVLAQHKAQSARGEDLEAQLACAQAACDRAQSELKVERAAREELGRKVGQLERTHRTIELALEDEREAHRRTAALLNLPLSEIPLRVVDSGEQ
jgi:chromosome segregation ATPase